jgi:hypothetical protein
VRKALEALPDSDSDVLKEEAGGDGVIVQGVSVLCASTLPGGCGARGASPPPVICCEDRGGKVGYDGCSCWATD